MNIFRSISTPVSSSDISNVILDSLIDDHNKISMELNLSSIGLPILTDRFEFASSVLKSISRPLKKHFLTLPAFTYSWGEKKACFSKNSLTNLGVLPNHIIENQYLYEFNRTNDPMFSTLYSDPLNIYFEAPMNQSSFGSDSFFSFLSKDTVLLHLGTKFFDPTVIHFVEELFFTKYSKYKSYRKNKIFSGYFCDDDTEQKWNAFMRYSGYQYEYNFEKLERDLQKNKLLKINHLGASRVVSISSNVFVDYLWSRLLNDPYYLIKE